MTLYYFLILFVFSAAFGCIIGAYFGTVEYRIRQDEPMATSHCHCPQCRHTLAPLHQIPIISWVVLGGRCYYCKAPIPKRYPLIEGGFLLYYGAVFLILWKHPFLTLIFWFGFVCALLLLRCQGHTRGVLKGLAIFAGYHVFYGIVLLCIYASLQLI